MAANRENDIPLISDESIVQFNKNIYYEAGWWESFYEDHDWKTAIYELEYDEIMRTLRLLLDRQKRIASSVDFIGIDSMPLAKEQKRTPALDHYILTNVKTDTNDFILYLEYLIRSTPKQSELPHNYKFEYMKLLGFFKSDTWEKLTSPARNLYLSKILGCNVDTARHLNEALDIKGNAKYRLSETKRQILEKEIEAAKKRV